MYKKFFQSVKLNTYKKLVLYNMKIFYFKNVLKKLPSSKNKTHLISVFYVVYGTNMIQKNRLFINHR